MPELDKHGRPIGVKWTSISRDQPQKKVEYLRKVLASKMLVCVDAYGDLCVREDEQESALRELGWHLLLLSKRSHLWEE